MKCRPWITLSLLFCCVSLAGTVVPSPESVVRKLYVQIVARRPLGIPKDADKAAIAPLLSKKLVQTLDIAQACQKDYFRHRANKGGKPGFAWLETGLFSGANERGIPSAAVIERTEPEQDGSFRVYVRLTYKESSGTYGRAPDPANTFHWRVAAIVIAEGGQFVVDDVLFTDGSAKVESRLSDFFSGCRGPRWTGGKH